MLMIRQEDEDEDEEEHPTQLDSVPPPVHHVTAWMSVRAQTPISLPLETEVARLLSMLTPPPLPLSPLSSQLPQLLSPLPQILLPPLPISPPPLHASPTYFLGYRAAMIRLRAESPSTFHPLPSSTPPSRTPPLLPIPLPTSSPPLLIPSTRHRSNVLEVTLPPQKRPTGGFKVDYGFVGTLDDEIRRDPERDVGYRITNTLDEMVKDMHGTLAVTNVVGLSQRMIDFITTVRQDTDRLLMSGQLNMLHYGFVGTLDDEIRRDPERDVGYRITNTLDEMVKDMHGTLAATNVVGLSQRMIDFITTVRQDTDRLLMSGQLNMLRSDRRTHDRTARLMKSEARLSREAWVQSMDASDTARVEVMSLRTTVLAQQMEIAGLRVADSLRQTHLVGALTLLKTL
nr:hypothetical protein [Tanacetum cinerariifolium]